MRGAARIIARLTFVAGLAVTPAVAHGQAPAAAPTAPAQGDAGARAVALGREGIQLYEAGRWAEAEAKLAEAEAVLHSPVFLLYIARCRRNAGRLLDAREAYRRTVAEQLAPTAPPAWQQALVDARAELSVVEPSIPSVVLRAPGASSDARVQIDGRPASIGVVTELDPGPHAVTFVDGGRRVETSIRVAPGERERVVDVAPSAPGPTTTTPGPAAAPGSSRAPAPGEGSWVPGAIVLGLGVVGLGVGAATGLVALGESAEVDDACPGGTCPAGVAPGTHDAQLGDARTMADVSTVSFIAGGVLAATGVVLLVVRPFGGEEVDVKAGAGGVVARGRF